MKKIFIFSVVIILCACQSTSQLTPTQTTVKSSDQKEAKTSYEGVYVFDSYRFKEEQLKYPDNMFKNVEPQNVDQVMKVFAPFQIKIEHGMATASFSNEVIRGQLKTITQNNREIQLSMIPVDEDKKDQILTLTITGDSLVMDPGKKETDKMYYRRAGSL